MAIRQGNTGAVPVTSLGLRFLLYGPPGSGKTWFGGTMDSPFFVFMPTETGKVALAMAGKKFDYVEVEYEQDLIQVLNMINDRKMAQNNRSIILDSLTDMTPLIVSQVLIETKATSMSLQKWGIAVDHLRMLITSLNRLTFAGKHVCLIAKSTMIKDDTRGGIFGVPDTIGRFQHTVGGLYDEVFFCEQYIDYKDPKHPTGRKAFRMHTATYKEAFIAKDSSGRLGLSEPNEFPLVYKKMMSGTPEAQEATAIARLKAASTGSVTPAVKTT